MEYIIKELGIQRKNVFTTPSNNLFTAVIHSAWLKKWLKNSPMSDSQVDFDFTVEPSESVRYPYRKIFIKVLNKKTAKVLPLPRYKLGDNNNESPLTFPQLLQYVSQNNHRNLWKESYKKYGHNSDCVKEASNVTLMEHDDLLLELILRVYGCNIIKVKNTEITANSKVVLRTYDTHTNLMAAMFTLETDSNFYVIFNGHYENTLLDCLNFSPNLIDKNYTRGLFVIYQLLNMAKTIGDMGFCIGQLTLQDIYLSENLWLQFVPILTNNIHVLDESLINEQSWNKPLVTSSSKAKVEEGLGRNKAVELEKLCMLWVRGRISNLDYLLHLNILAGRQADDPQCHFIVPWVTDFSTRIGRSWRDLTKSKYRLTKGDRQLDLTYEVTSLEDCPEQIPHHVTDALSDITCYVYLARRTPKDILCKHVRNKWVPAEYPASIQRMQEWTPDECIPEFYTDPLVFKSIHEDLPDLEVPSWCTCVEDFITKHREALESAYVSENLHHWIDHTFGYKLSGTAAIKAKNVCLSLVDGHTKPRRGSAVQVLSAPHPARWTRAQLAAPPRLHWTLAKDSKRQMKTNDSSDGVSEEDEESNSVHQHVSRLSVPSQHLRARHRSSHRARSLSKASDHDSSLNSSAEIRASSHSRHYRVQKSELGKGIIYLPKEYNPVASIQALESLENFKTKCFFSKSGDSNNEKEKISMLNLCPNQDLRNDYDNVGENSFTNRMFLASYEQNYFKKFNQEAQMLKDRKMRRAKHNRYTADAAIYKKYVTEARRKDMLTVGCLIVEIFLHTYMRPLRLNSDNFTDRYNNCRTVLKYDFHSIPKCVSYIASLLLNVQPLSLNSKVELSPNIHSEECDISNKITVTDKGLPPPTASQLLQPLLSQHLIPFPQTFSVIYKLLSTLHEYQLTSNDLKVMYTYECDGLQCDKYHNVDNTKSYFAQKIAEGKVQACAVHLDALLTQITCFNQFDVLDIFLSHYTDLLENRETSVLAAWYLFDTVSKALGPAETRKKLLKHILNLYEDDDFMDKSESKCSEADSPMSSGKHKFVKLYHNIFLLQLMVRLGLQCFLDNFTQHLVEAVGGYKDAESAAGSPSHQCRDKVSAHKKPRYSDDTVKNALINASDIFSPDTSYGSENIITPNVEKVVESESSKDTDNRSENELFHLEMDKERISSRSSRSKSPSESLDSYTLSAQQEAVTPSPSAEGLSPKLFLPNSSNASDENKKKETANTDDPQMTSQPTIVGPTSPTVDIPKTSLFTSYLHFADEKESSYDDIEFRNRSRASTSFEFSSFSKAVKYENESKFEDDKSYKISDMSSESLLWLSHRLGPVLTCRYITKNLLKMLTLCYIGKENLSPTEVENDSDEFDAITIAKSRVSGDKNALKVIKCLTSIVVMFGEQVILFQYLPHMGELIASCRRRLSAPLEGGVVACLQLLKYLVPLMSDAKLMEQLQDTFLKSILHPTLRLLSTTRCTFPNGVRARAALARKFLDTLYVLAVRIGPEMTRKHLCVPALQRFFLTFDKASGKLENWPKTEVDRDKDKSSTQTESVEPKIEGFLEICRDGTTAEWSVRNGLVVRDDAPPDVSCSPPEPNADCTRLTAQGELLMAFNEELAHRAYVPFMRLVGSDTMERSLKNNDTVQALCVLYDANNTTSPPCNIIHDKTVQSSISEENLKKIDIVQPKSDLNMSSSNSFGSNVTVVGNRIDVAPDTEEDLAQGLNINALNVVAYKGDNGFRSNRHLRGNWLIYWEHEIGRPDKEMRFNLKQIKLQQFCGHTQSVKSIHCLDNESSFMSGSKDKTVRLWSLRNQGDGNATSACNWTYTGHKKGILSLTFLESLRLAVSTDSVVHIWDPFMESVVSQLDNIKAPISIVRTLPGPSTAIVCATTDATVKVIDARTCSFTHDLKLPGATNTFIRCMCVSPNGRWVSCGLATGHLVVLDTRTGMPLASWKAHDGEVLRVAAVDHKKVISSGLDQTTAIWMVGDGELVTHLKGTTEPVHCLSVHDHEVISGTTNNRIGVHSLVQESFNSSKLRADSFKGNLTSMAVLPRNRLLLLGNDHGTISLLC